MTSFTHAHRLHHKREFDFVYKAGRRHSDPLFQVIVTPNTRDHARIGLSVAVKAIGKATNRNRVKRVVRESFRVVCERLPSLDIVVSARPGARTASNADLARSLERLWDKLVRYG